MKVWVVDNYVDNMIHVSTGDGTYRLNREDFKGGDHTHLKYNFFDPGSLEHFTLQDVAQIRNYNRVAIIDDVLFHNSSMIQSSIFQNPANHYKGSYDLFDVGDKIAYNPQAMGSFIFCIIRPSSVLFMPGEGLRVACRALRYVKGYTGGCGDFFLENRIGLCHEY